VPSRFTSHLIYQLLENICPTRYCRHQRSFIRQLGCDNAPDALACAYDNCSFSRNIKIHVNISAGVSALRKR
jgi:hypothetical protein